MSKLFWVFLTFGFGLMFLGIVFNMNAIVSNGCKMPVYTDNYRFESNLHKTFTEPSEVNLFLLTDIIQLPHIILSFGDVFLLTGWALVSGACVGSCIFFMLERHRKKVRRKLEILEILKRQS